MAGQVPSRVVKSLGVNFILPLWHSFWPLYLSSIEDMLAAKINKIMASIPLVMGISSHPWRHAFNVMLEKVAGNC